MRTAWYGEIGAAEEALRIGETARVELRLLPPSGPHLNSVEMALSKFKAFLKKTTVRTVNDL